MKHHIICKFKDTVSKEELKAMLPDIQALFDHCNEIPGVEKTELIPNVIDRPNRYDLMIRMTMTEDALPVYDQCRWHKEWKQNYGDLLEAKAIFDSEE